ncbi:hypothetical protein [Candidatus Formimonas warabiya]|uniref:hypothetical protein n=1 Tax=Formimonas warabiya TaxID=1761012 RepID=UPI001F21D8BB|nr:hypothetical protein [Candidatus Formimonas warabiya]
MNLSKGFDLTKRFYPLVFVPIILDFLQLGDILRRAQGFALKFTIPSAVPSLTQVLADPPQSGTGSIAVNLPFSYLEGAFLLLFILFLLTGAFLKGGFLGCVLAGIKGYEVSVDTFISCAKKFFSRFLLQVFIIFFLLLVVTPLFLALRALTFLFLIGIMILFFYLIFWDYIIVVENVRVIDAAKISWNLVRSNIGKVFSFILPIALITALIGIIANALVATSLIFAVIAIITYGYFGTAVVFTMMSFYLEFTEIME